MAFSLFGFNRHHEEKNVKNQVVSVPLDQIEPNRYQPRKVFNPEEIQELAQTIDEHGLLQPIVLREYEPSKYEIIAGERRFRAMKLLKWETAPAIVEKMSDKESASLALVENLQRADLSPVEEAQAYRRLMKMNGLTQKDLAKGMGKSQSTIANKLRLLKLIPPVQNAILDHRISERHGRALLGLDEKQQRDLLMDIVNDHWTVRQTEDYVDVLLGKTTVPSPDGTVNGAGEDQPTAQSDQEQSKSKPAKKTGGSQNKKKPRKRRRRLKKTNRTTDPQIALNTIRQSIRMVNQSGVKIQATEQNDSDAYKFIITIPKKEE
ncbi:nucleoid occlusion protein [Limosilactobacillus sp.]|uniref:nucleoid occlusion protein n=1 Tax=Limosilactobacillus sp. TaxID=2773925 RepID=UPI00345E76A5